MAKEYPEFIKSLPAFDGPFDAYKLGADKFDVLFAQYPAGTDIPTHQHDTENIGVVTSGCLQLETGGETRLFKPGDWYHLVPCQTHAARFTEDTQLIEFWFQKGAD